MSADPAEALPPDVLRHAAQDCFGKGDGAGAARHYRALLHRDPEATDALMMLGVLAQRAGRLSMALDLTEAALATPGGQAPGPRARILTNYATLLRQADRRDEAFAAALRALDGDPSFPEALNTAGWLARERGELDKACAWLEQAVAQAPGQARYRSNLAVARLARGDARGAWEEATEALRLAPNDPSALMTVASALRGAGHADKAVAFFRATRTLQPDHEDSWVREAEALLVGGRWAEGWALWERRPLNRERFAALPRWAGEPCPSLLLVAEQGYGDALQFLRFAESPWLRDRTARIVLQIPAALRRLVRDSLPGLELMDPTDPVPAATAWCPLMSLPFLMNLVPQDVPPPCALRTEEPRRQKWRARFAGLAKPRVGLIGAGNPRQPNNANRSIPTGALRPFVECFAPALVSLQKEEGAFGWPASAGDILRVGPELEDFADTAAAMAELDLVISVCTSSAHLAGNLGRPVWIPLAFEADWRWLYGTTRSVWYPTARLFRAREPGDWTAALEDLAAALTRFRETGALPLADPLPAAFPARNPFALALPGLDALAG